MSLILAALLGAGAPEATVSAADTIESDLRCVAWAAEMTGKAKDEDPEAAKGIGLVLTYFVGRWEGATGRPIEQGLTASYLREHEAKIDGYTAECLPRMESFGKRMTNLGAALMGK